MLRDIARPDADGRFGKFGGKYVPETLIPALLELTTEYEEALKDEAFQVRASFHHVQPSSARAFYSIKTLYCCLCTFLRCFV
jgi:tryptophan synthase beta subunit